MTAFAFLCDAYNPLLLIISIVFIFRSTAKTKSILAFIMLLVICYGLMFIDNAFHIWLRFSLDYSTHTATALAMTIFIGWHIRNITVWFSLAILLLVYAVMMKLLNYHGFLDVISTSIIIAPLMLFGLKFIWQFSGRSDRLQ